MKRNSLLDQMPLQGQDADAQLESDIFQSRSLTSQKLLQNSLRLLFEGLVRELLRYKRVIYILHAEGRNFRLTDVGGSQDFADRLLRS